MGIIYKIDNLINSKCYTNKTLRSLGEKQKYKEAEKAGG